MVQIAVESLTERNYEYWRECVKTYLIGNDLWDVISKTDDELKQDEEWERKNARALHAIQISSGSDTFSKIKKLNSAKLAWKYLAEKRKGPRQPRKQLQSTDGTLQVEHHEYLTFYEALIKDNLQAMTTFIENQTNACEAKLTTTGNTALHVAVMPENSKIAKRLVEIMPEKTLEITNNEDHTGLSLASIMGCQDAVEAIVRKNKNLITLKHRDGLLPVVVAALYGNEKMVRYLYHKTLTEELNSDGFNGATRLNCLIIDGIYDLALELLEKYPKLGVMEDIYGNNALKLLAHRPSVFSSGSELHLVFWKSWIYKSIRLPKPESSQGPSDDGFSTTTKEKLLTPLNRFGWTLLDKCLDINHIYQKKLEHDEVKKILKCICNQLPQLSNSQLEGIGIHEAVKDAIKHGIIEFIQELIEWYPDIIWKADKYDRTIFAHAIIQRQEKIFNIIFEQGSKKHMMVLRHDIFGNNFLHLAAKLSPCARLERISGEALQMQRELQWFKELESIVPPKFMEELNKNNKTPKALFTEEHKNLEKEGEKWMKSTAGSCMIVATLIAAVMFTSAFTVPGGDNQETGLPIFLKSDAFLVFTIANALSLFSSSTSVLMFVGILTSRYAEKDFLISLPIKLMAGLSSLFISIATMMIAFGSAIYITLTKQLSWVSIPIIVFATLPVGLFAIQQFPLFAQILICTCGRGVFNEEKHRLVH